MRNISTIDEALNFVTHHGVVLESGAGPVPSLSEAIAGGPFKGSWWSHREAKSIFALTRAVRDSPDVLVCKAIGGKVTYVHKRLWPAVVRLSGRLGASRFNRVIEEHTPGGKHVLRTEIYPHWVPRQVMIQAEDLNLADAEILLRGAFTPIRCCTPSQQSRATR